MRVGINYQTTNMNDMKHMITSQLAVLLLFAAGMAGCSEEDARPGGTTTNPDSDRCPITVSVSDGGYMANAPSAPGTRTVEEGYTTRFTAGDKIGLYAVKDGAIVASNICLTAETGSSGNGIAWQVPEGTTLYYEGAGTKYFAYYPWQSTLSGSPDASATDATGFFADVVSRWTPATDQGTYAKYTAQDLMTSSGTPCSKQPNGTYSLSFTLTHAMALVVIETPVTKYTLTDVSGSTSSPGYTWTAEAPDTRFYGFTPYSPAVGTYRYLVKPGQSGAGDLMGSYTATTGGTTATKEYAVTQNGLIAARYAFYKVDNATVTEKSHTLQAGDFYLSDGSLVSKDAALTDAQKQACIGIVMKAGKDNSGDWADLDTYKDKGGNTMSTIHGYVLALKDGNGGSVCAWGSYGIAVGTNQQQNTLFYGYSNTQTIKSYASSNSKNLQSDFPAAYHASVGYETAYPAPTNSSGWFFPSTGQCWYWYQNKDVLKSSMDKAGGNGWQSYYWSSTELSGYAAIGAWFVNFSNGSVGNVTKSNVGDRRVRSCLAF